MPEVDVGGDEDPIIAEDPPDLGEFLLLGLPGILEEPLCQDDIEFPLAKLDRVREKIGLNKIRRWFLYRYVNPVVVDVPVQEMHQSCRPAADVEEIARTLLGQFVDDPRGFFQPEVRFDVVQVFFDPEISLVNPVPAVHPQIPPPAQHSSRQGVRAVLFGLVRLLGRRIRPLPAPRDHLARPTRRWSGSVGSYPAAAVTQPPARLAAGYPLTAGPKPSPQC